MNRPFLSVALVSLFGATACASSSPQSMPDPEAAMAEPAHPPHHDHGASHDPSDGNHAHAPEGHDPHAPAPHEVRAHGHQHHFADPAAYAARWESAERSEWQRPAELVDALAIEPGMSVADIGTGTGYLLPWLSAAAGPEGAVLAVDLSAEMLAWVQERAARESLGNVYVVRASETSPGIGANTLDRGIMINVWHHIENRVAYGEALFGATRPGGRIFIVETKVDAATGPPRHYRMAPEAVIEELEAAGFDAELHPFAIDRQYVVVATRPGSP